MSKLLIDVPFRTMLGQIETAINFRQVMERGEVVLVNLAPKHLDMGLGRVLGAMIVRELFFVATQRDVATANRNPCYLYVDECARFLTNDVADLLTETAKFGLHATLAHQNLAQMETESPKVYGAMMGIQNKVIFGGLSDKDARILADELFRTEYDIEKPVEALTRPVAVGTRRIWLSNWSTSESESESESSSTSTSESESEASGERVDEDGYPVTETTYSTSQQGTSTTETSSRSRSTARSSSEGASESFETIYKESTTAVHSLQTIQHLATARLRALPARNAVVRGSAQQTFDILTYDINPSIIAPSTRDAFIERTMKRSVYSVPAAIAQKTIDQRIEQMVKRAKEWKSPGIKELEPEEWRG